MTPSQDHCRSALDAYLANPHPNWFDAAQLLELVEDSGFWSEHAPSFSKWMTAFSERISLSESSLWRFKAAYRILSSTMKMLGELQVALPPIETLAEKATPENLELYERISRVLATHGRVELGTKVVLGLISRTELRALWKIYRPLLDGKTSRGHGVEAPRIEDHARLFATQIQAEVFSAIRSDPKWLFADGSTVRTFLNVSMPPAKPREAASTLDAVIAVQRHLSEELELHIIDIIDEFQTPGDLLKRARSKLMQGHYLWFAANFRSGSYLSGRELPENVGLLLCEAQHVVVFTRAKRTAATRVGVTAMALLKETLHR